MTAGHLTLGVLIDATILLLASRRWRIRLTWTRRASIRLRDSISPYHGALLAAGGGKPVSVDRPFSPGASQLASSSGQATDHHPAAASPPPAGLLGGSDGQARPLDNPTRR